jgi:hypothetical protein
MGNISPHTYEDIISGYKGPKRKRYEQAYEALQADGILNKDFIYRAFVKFEQLKGSRFNRPPRIIQFSSFKIILFCMRYVKAIEAKFPELRDFTGTSMFFKGMNQQLRAETMLRKWACFNDPVAVMGDGKHWDVNVTPRQLMVKHQLYRWVIRDEEFHSVCAKELKTRVRTRLGVAAQYTGNVRSGSADTGAGNSLLAVIMLLDYFKGVGITRYAIADDGDDFHIYVERSDLNTVITTIVERFALYGHELKLEGVADCIHQIDFCQSRLVHTIAGPVMVRDPRKVLSNALCTNKFKTPKAMQRFVRSVGECELSLNHGVPILQAFALALLRNTPDVRPLPPWEVEAFQHRVWSLNRDSGPGEITNEARDSFDLAFGIPREEQERIERALGNWEICFEAPMCGGEDLSPSSWTQSYGPETFFPTL